MYSLLIFNTITFKVKHIAWKGDENDAILKKLLLSKINKVTG